MFIYILIKQESTNLLLSADLLIFWLKSFCTKCLETNKSNKSLVGGQKCQSFLRRVLGSRKFQCVGRVTSFVYFIDVTDFIKMNKVT